MSSFSLTISLRWPRLTKKNLGEKEIRLGLLEK